MSDNILTLEWTGPYCYGPDGLHADGGAPHWASDTDFRVARGKPGLYLVCVDHPIHGRQALGYIGRSDSIGERLDHHEEWLRAEWDARVFVAPCEEKVLKDAEALLIYAHSPIYNGVGVWNPPGVPRDFHVRNTGRFWGLYPDVCAAHPWHSR